MYLYNTTTEIAKYKYNRLDYNMQMVYYIEEKIIQIEAI